jgi:hypothetical protein
MKRNIVPAKDSGRLSSREIQLASARAEAASTAEQEALRHVRLTKTKLKMARKAHKHAKKAARKAVKQNKKAEAYLQSVLAHVRSEKPKPRPSARGKRVVAPKSKAANIAASQAAVARRPKVSPRKVPLKDSRIPAPLASTIPGPVEVALHGAGEREQGGT